MGWISVAGICAGVAVLLGAFGAHGLKDVLDPHQLSVFQTGVRYQMWHSLALLGFGLFEYIHKKPFKSLTGWFFVGGIFLFSGSLYLLGVLNKAYFGYITPLGGLCFICGWFSFAYSSWKVRR